MRGTEQPIQGPVRLRPAVLTFTSEINIKHASKEPQQVTDYCGTTGFPESTAQPQIALLVTLYIL